MRNSRKKTTTSSPELNTIQLVRLDACMREQYIYEWSEKRTTFPNCSREKLVLPQVYLATWQSSEEISLAPCSVRRFFSTFIDFLLFKLDGICSSKTGWLLHFVPYPQFLHPLVFLRSVRKRDLVYEYTQLWFHCGTLVVQLKFGVTIDY